VTVAQEIVSLPPPDTTVGVGMTGFVMSYLKVAAAVDAVPVVELPARSVATI
jgi:hypothetical protein